MALAGGVAVCAGFVIVAGSFVPGAGGFVPEVWVNLAQQRCTTVSVMMVRTSPRLNFP